MDVQKLLESDPELGRFILEQEQQSRMKKMAEKLTNDCWDLCMTNPNVSRLDTKTESCLANCVDRFLDTNTYVLNLFANKGQAALNASGASGFDDTHSIGGLSSSTSTSSPAFGDSGLIFEDKLGGDSKSGESKTKSGWKFW